MGEWWALVMASLLVDLRAYDLAYYAEERRATQTVGSLEQRVALLLVMQMDKRREVVADVK